MTNLFVLSAILLPKSPVVQASETHLCTVDQNSSVDSDRKGVVFSTDNYDHFTYDLIFSAQSAVLKQNRQLDGTNLVRSRIFMNC